MQYSEGSIGRVFTLRLEDKDHLPDCLEKFAKEKNIASAFCLLIGGVDNGQVVSGPKDPAGAVIDPMLKAIAGAHEIAAVGTIYQDEDANPLLHMHAALGRGDDIRMGCIRPGLDVWLVGECIVVEILDSGMIRKTENKSGLKLLIKE